MKLPGVFLHRPLSHSSLFIRHSSISGGDRKRAVIDQLSVKVPTSWSDPPTNAVFARQVHLEALVAAAFVRPQHVLAHSVVTDVWVQGAFVNI